jgi:acyl-CoA synthetase (AMP-forming)/AMP-acid ligase II
MLLLDNLRSQTESATAKFIWLGSDGQEEETLTGVQIYQRAGAVAHMLVAAKLKPGDRAMIAYPPGLDFLAALIGCARAGVICCSVYPPDPSKLKKSFAHFCTFAKDAGTDFVLTTSTMKKLMQGAALLHGPRGLKYIVTDSAKKSPKPFVDVPIQDKDIMFIQYTSGSTGNPKGVMISHGALTRNVAFMQRSHNVTRESIIVCWLPQYHDYGLVTNYLGALQTGSSLVCMSPISFIRDPLLWPKTIVNYKSNFTCGPNFAYSLIHRKWIDAGRPQLDLSSLQSISIAAEPINPSTIEKTKEMGIPSCAIRSSYGLAENVVFVTCILRCPPPVLEDRVACGVAEFGTKRIYVNGDGEIFVQGDDLASGYWNRPKLTQETFHNILPGLEGEWLCTGDIGFIHDGLLYVTGRKKELIKVRGKNYFPTDIEADVEKAFGEFLRPGCSAAFQHTDASIGYVAEVRDEKNMPDTNKITQHILAEHGVQCTYIKLGPKGSLPKTTSGKIKRTQVQADARAELQAETTQADALNDKHSSYSSSGPDAASFIQAIEGKDIGTLDLDKSLAENGADSLTQVDIENRLAASKVLTERQRAMLRSGSSLREIALELADSTERPRNIEVKYPPIRKARTLPISTFTRSTGMCLINLINLAIPLSIAGAVYEMTVQWGGILVWAALHTACVAICLRMLTFGGADSFVIECNTTAYLRWYFCRNMLTIWNAFIGTWVAGTLPYVVFLNCIGARVHPSAVVDNLFEYVDTRLQIRPHARVAGICDTAAHVNAYKMRFGPVTIGANANVRGSSRMWPGSQLGENSSLDHWCRLTFDEQVKHNMKVAGEPAVAEPTSENSSNSSSNASYTWINVNRLLIIPAAIFAALYSASFVQVHDPFLQYLTTYFLGSLFIIAFAPTFKRTAIDCFKGGPNLAETVDRFASFAFQQIMFFFYPHGGPLSCIYHNLFGAHYSLDTVCVIAPCGKPSQASRLTIINKSFYSADVRLCSGSGPIVIDNSECAYGAVVPDRGIKDVQLLRHYVTLSRKDTRRPNNSLVFSIITSWSVAAAMLFPLYPLYLLGCLARSHFLNKTVFVLCTFIPGVIAYTVVALPLVVRVFSTCLKLCAPSESWLMLFYFVRMWGSIAFFAGSPLHNIAMRLAGTNVNIHARVFGGTRDDARISIPTGAVVDPYVRVMGHLYNQGEFVLYQTKLSQHTLYDGPANYVGTPARLH